MSHDQVKIPSPEVPVAAGARDVAKDRAQDRGHFNQYGMRDDPRGANVVDKENPGDGDGPRRFGAGGDESTYENRAHDSASPGATGPILAVDSSGSSRGLGLDYGGEAHKGARLSSRQGSELIGELDKKAPEAG